MPSLGSTGRFEDGMEGKSGVMLAGPQQPRAHISSDAPEVGPRPESTLFRILLAESNRDKAAHHSAPVPGVFPWHTAG